MKKTFLFTAIILAFLSFSCDNEPYGGEIFIEDPSTGTPTDPVDPTTPKTSLQLADYDYIKNFSFTSVPTVSDDVIITIDEAFQYIN